MAAKKKARKGATPSAQAMPAQPSDNALTTLNNQLQDRVGELEAAHTDMANVLNGSDIAILFLDIRFCIQRYTPLATQLFNVITTDLGRPISDITPKFPDGALQRDVEQVLRTFSPLARQVQTSDGRWWSQRITLYRTLDNRVEGVILSFADVTHIKHSDEQARRLATVLLDSNDAVTVHDFDGKITAWNRSAEEMLGYTEAEALRMNVEQIIPEKAKAHARSCWERLRLGEQFESWESQRRTKDGRILDVWITATVLKDEAERPVAIAKTERDITEQKRARDALRKSQEQLSAVLHTAADAIITIDATGIIQSVNKATERMFGYTAVEMIGQKVNMLMPSPYQEEHDRYLANYANSGVKKIIGIGREVSAQRKDGATFPVDLAVSAVDHLGIFTGILRDITRRKQLEREVVEIASREQRRIGQDLHDSVGQELTALNIQITDLAETLRTDPSGGAKLVEQMTRGLQRSQQELRAVLRGLLPVAMDAGGLVAALSDFADRIQREGKVACAFCCPLPISVADNLTATHLYLIAQEAVHNAIKHARARNIHISLESNALLTLSVQDDGIGMPAEPTETHGGLGLRIMQNRASIIGAALAIQPAAPTGTLVTCALLRKSHET